MLWTAKVFDYVNKKITNDYWDLADVDYFVDSTHGDDSTGTGTASNPWKTIAKVKASGTWANGTVIMVNGVFDEVTDINVGVIIIGVGGGLGGRTIFAGGIAITAVTTSMPTFENIMWYRTTRYVNPQTTSSNTSYYYNCFFEACHFYGSDNSAQIINYYAYYCIYKDVNWYALVATRAKIYHYGNNNTYYNNTSGHNFAWFFTVGNNLHWNTNVAKTDLGFKNQFNVDGEYLDPANYNFNFLNTSPLYRTGTYNGSIGNYNHVGAGTEGANLNALNDELKNTSLGGDATYTNLIASGSDIYRPNVTIDGILESGYIDFGDIKDQVLITLNNTYEYDSGKLLRLIQDSTTGLTQREGLDFLLKYGDSTAEVDSCPWLNVEFGKIIAISGTGASRVGNADLTFDPTTAVEPSFQYCKVKLKFVTKTL